MDYVYIAETELDAASVKANFSTFVELAGQQKDLTIDMSSVKTLDGSGLGALAFVYKRLRSAGYQIRLVNVSNAPLSMLKELGIAEILLANQKRN